MENSELSKIEIKKQKKAEYDSHYYAENADKIKEKAKCYREKNADKLKAYEMARKERKKEYMKCYNAKNAEKRKEWKKNNKDKIKEQRKRYNIKYYNKIINNMGLTKAKFKIALTAWSAAVKERDGNICCYCNSTENLHAHHILSKIKHPHLALILSNGITICQICHAEEHKLNGLL